MHEARASLTAALVAFARAVATHDPELSRICRDPLAERFIPKPYARLIRGASASPRPDAAFRALRTLSLGMVDHLALRTAVIDEALESASVDKTPQVVLLGAGLDARAHRLDALREATVFEVDHPATQAVKRRRVEAQTPLAREVRYAACDFAETTLDDALAASDFDAKTPSFWIWEGVTMYLPEPAVCATMDTIARLTTAGSSVINTYITPELAHRGRALTQLGKGALGAISEPVLSTFTPEQIASRWRERGFAVLADQLPLEQADRFGVGTSLAWVVPDERVVLSRR